MGFQKKVYSTVYEFLKWNIREINYIKDVQCEDVIISMFNHIRKTNLNTCQIVCRDPDNHFNIRKCFPLYKVHQTLKAIDLNSSNYLLKSELRREVLRRINNEEKFLASQQLGNLNEDHYPIYSLPSFSKNLKHINKKIVLIVDFGNYEKFTGENEVIFYTGLKNLLDNINQNFICMMTPEMNLQKNSSWKSFISNQIANVNIIITVFSSAMTQKLCEWESMGHSFQDIPETENKQDPLNIVWNKIKSSTKPVIGVVFDNTLEESASSIVPVVFYLPRNLKLLFGYLLSRMKDF